MLFGLFGETRSLENPSTPLSSILNFDDGTGLPVTETTALGVSAIWAAVNLVSGTLGHLPLHLYRTADGSKEKAKNDPTYRILHDATNDVHTKTDYWKWATSRMLLDGRAVSLIVRNKGGRVAGIVPLDLTKLKITQTVSKGRLQRSYEFEGGQTYDAIDVLDFNLYPRGDGIGHYAPLTVHKNTIALLIAAERYASNLFAGGGLPPLALSGPLGSPEAQDRASESFNAALTRARDRKRPIINLPQGFDLKPLGFDPSKNQLVELRTFMVSEVSRLFNVPPALLHDLSKGTYSNTEQQNLAFAQHTITPLVELVEAEMNNKLFRNGSNFVEFDLSGLMRGDLKSRMEALAQGVQNGLLTPNEGRALENRPPMEGGDKLYIQGATVPLNDAGEAPDLAA